MNGFKKFIEMPISNMEFFPPDWEKDKRGHGWNKQDVGILTSGLEKFKRLWNNTEFNFEFYMVKTKEGRQYQEIGEVNKEFIQKI